MTLATYLAAQYTAGAEGGDYVFLCLNSDSSDVTNYYYWTIDSANGTNMPVLTIEINGGE